MILLSREDFASDEEWHVYHWLLEAEKSMLISDITYQPGPFELAPRARVKVLKQLKTKTKAVDKFLFHPHEYTPDFIFHVPPGSLSGVFRHPIMHPYHETVYVDVKGSFNKFGDPKQFSLNQKWMFQRFGIYVEKIIPEKLFKKTWVPEICRLSPKKRQPVKKYIGVPTITDFLRDRRI